MATIPIANLLTIYGEDFSDGVVSDKEFSHSDLEAGKLRLSDVLPGGFEIIDGNGNVVSVPQRELVESGVCVGVELDFSDATVVGTWKIRLRRGRRGDGPLVMDSDPPSDEVVKYALIFS